jgi:hypothetical protein
MQQVANNEYYDLGYDSSKNRVYWSMKGFWPGMSAVPNFEKDWDTIQSMVKPGFDIFADISTLKTMPDDVKDAQDRRQVKLVTAGCRKVGTLVQSAVTKISMNQAIQGSGIDKILRYCATPDEVEAFFAES